VLYSSACEYAIRALSFMASREEGSRVKLRDIAEAEEIPGPFLSSILQRLVSMGVLQSTRGRAGGYTLTRDPAGITLLEIKTAVDGKAGLEACALGLDTCSDAMPCPLHDSWKPLRLQIRRYLEKTTVKDMADALVRKRATQGAGRR